MLKGVYSRKNIELIYDRVWNHLRDSFENNLDESLRLTTTFDPYSKHMIHKRNMLWNVLLKQKHTGLYFCIRQTKPKIYCKREFLFTYFKYIGS